MIDNENFVKQFNQNFSPPFLPEGFAKAHLQDDNSIVIQIGPRDLHLGPNGEPFGSGSLMTHKWIIKRKHRHKSNRRLEIGREDLIEPKSPIIDKVIPASTEPVKVTSAKIREKERTDNR